VKIDKEKQMVILEKEYEASEICFLGGGGAMGREFILHL